MRAGTKGVPLPAGATAPAALAVTSLGIRPGGWLLTLLSGRIIFASCTANFIFVKNGSYAIGTAGHCIDKVGDPVTMLFLPRGLVRIGKAIAKTDGGIGKDFGLIAIDPALNQFVNCSIAVLGGPTGTFTGGGAQVVEHIGHGVVVGTGGTPRAGVATTWFADSYGWDSPSAPGDSGSPVRLATGQAAGNLTHLVVGSKFLPSVVAGTRISKMLQLAKGWSLCTASLVPSP